MGASPPDSATSRNGTAPTCTLRDPGKAPRVTTSFVTGFGLRTDWFIAMPPLLSTEQERLYAPSASSAGANRFRFEGTRDYPISAPLRSAPGTKADCDPGAPQVKAACRPFLPVRKFQNGREIRSLRHQNAKRLATPIAGAFSTG